MTIFILYRNYNRVIQSNTADHKREGEKRLYKFNYKKLYKLGETV